MFSMLLLAAETAAENGTQADIAEQAADISKVDAHEVTTAIQHAVGMPQLDSQNFGNLIFWLLVTLAALYWVLSKTALPRIGAVISDRQDIMTGDLMQAEEYKKKAKEAEAAYGKALADARTEANKIVAAQKAEIQKELDVAIAKADAEIAARTAESEKRIMAIRESAVSDARSVAREVTAELVRTFGGKPEEAVINKAVDLQLKGASQ